MGTSPLGSERSGPVLIAVDGGAGTGKTTLVRRLVSRLGWSYFNGGQIYRAVCWVALREGVLLDDEDAVVSMISRTNLSVRLRDHATVLLQGSDPLPKSDLRAPLVDRWVPVTSAHPKVRQWATKLQRDFVAGLDGVPGLIVDGRDVTSVVFPFAEVRVLLTANESRRTGAGQRSDTRRNALDARVADFQEALSGVLLLDMDSLSLQAAENEIVAALDKWI